MANLKELFLPMLALCIMCPLAFAIDEDLLVVEYHIHIINDLPSDLPPNIPALSLHCKSKDKDLGEKNMLEHQDYTWDSRINLLRTTLFFCNARWEGKQRYFEAFKATRDEHRCRVYHNSCLWSMRHDGIYFSNDNSSWTNEYPW
ncbi:S-protein homolog 18-like [Herrania umbratica]|uniref:S-protein homolog n=1 Tax=Herrania umbratica TaxID=108875 RepID=A0A6J1AUV4_9ROSI|nr:S-protein homolog 18-like [Herrania umbratica]